MPRRQGRIDPDGAIIRVRLQVPESVELFNRSQGGAPPPPFVTTGLIDTGASQTAFHPMIVPYLRLRPRGFAPVGTPGHPLGSRPEYDVRLAFDHPGLPNPAFDIQAVAAAPATPSVLVLIGRDVLDHCTLYFDGQNKLFSLWY